MTRAGPSTPAIDQLAVYETLRAAVLSGHSNGQCGLAILTQLSYRYASDSRNAPENCGFYGRSRFVVLKITVLSEDIWH